MSTFTFLLPAATSSVSSTPVSEAIDASDGTWAGYPLLSLIPEVHQALDADVGDKFINFLSAFLPIWDYYREKIRDLGDLRDPLRVPADTSFNRPVIVLQVDDIGDGTSRVFLSQGVDGDKFESLRPGMVLTDSSESRFPILEINSSNLPADFDDVPIDPYTGNETGRNVVVRNISLANLESIPAVSGYLIEDENPTPTPVDNGSSVGPYLLTAAWAPLAENLVTVTWTESAVEKIGYFNNQGLFSGQLRSGSSINFVTGVIVIDPANGVAVDSNSIRITYTTQQIYQENPIPVPIDDGINTGPYVFTAGVPPLAAHIVTVQWSESSVAKTGVFSSGGVPSGDLHASSTINFTTGVISAVNVGGAAVDEDTFRVSYLSAIVLSPTDARINAQHILAFLGSDYGITLDRHDPETLQRSYVYHAYKLWDLKGSAEGYEVLGKFAGFIVRPRRLYKIAPSFGASVGVDHEFVFAGLEVVGEDPGSAADNYISPAEDGVLLGPFVIQVTHLPIYSDDDIVLTWHESGVLKTATLTPGDAVTGTDAANIASMTVDRLEGKVTVTFQSAHAPQADSVLISYTQGQYYTDIDPDTARMDDVVLDAAPLDSYCFDTDELYPSDPHYPTVPQCVDVTAVVSLGDEGGGARYLVTVSTATYSTMHMTLGTDGTFIDFASTIYLIENFKWLTASTYSFEIVDSVAPVTGKATVKWQAIKNLSYFVKDDPDWTPGSTISPDENGTALGPFSIQLANYPLWDSTQFATYLTVVWKKAGVDKTATLSGTTGTTITGTDASNLASSLLNRTTGVLTLTWNATFAPDTDSIRITYAPVSDFVIIGIGTDLINLGAQYTGFSGMRFRLTKTFIAHLSVGNVGQWKLIDAEGNQFWLEKITLKSSSPYVYEMEFIAPATPAAGPANIFYVCETIPTCAFCAASAIRLTLEPDAILEYPEIDVSDAADRLIERLKQMIPAHVRVADFELIV